MTFKVWKVSRSCMIVIPLHNIQIYYEHLQSIIYLLKLSFSFYVTQNVWTSWGVVNMISCCSWVKLKRHICYIGIRELVNQNTSAQSFVNQLQYLQISLQLIIGQSKFITVHFDVIWLFSLQEVDAKPQSLLIEYIKENSWVKILQAYLGAYGLVKVSKDNSY